MWLWIVVSATILALVVAFRVCPWARARRDGPSAAWFAAAIASALLLVLIAARMVELMPALMAVDVGVLAVAGVLTGWFLGIELTPRDRQMS